MQSACIFATSKYYRQAYANASKISQPLGYNFLSKKQQIIAKKPKGQLVKKIFFDKPLIKTLSTKPTPLQKIQQFLLVSDSKRKNTYLSVNPLSIVNKTSQQISQQLSSKYFLDSDKNKSQFLDFINTLNNISDEVLFTINDYALSTYLIFYFGKNANIKRLSTKIMDQQFVEYNVKNLCSFNIQNDKSDDENNNIVEFDQNFIKNKQKIDDFIKRITLKGNQIDPMYSGLHFFIGDCTSFTSTHQILKQEIQNLKYLQFYLYLMTSGVLGNGQNALLKIRGTMRNKTIDLLFLFKLIFSKITLIKPPFSNFLSPQKYLFCEGYISQNGDQVHKFISQNFNLLAEYGQQKLLINPQLIFREEVVADNTKNFNDSSIVRGIKQVLEIYLKNSNLEIYPTKSLLMQKLRSLTYADEINELIEYLELTVPNEEDIKNQTGQQDKNGNNQYSKDFKSTDVKPIFEQKQASIDIFELLKKAKQQGKPVQKQVQLFKVPKKDEEEQMQGRILQRFKQQQRIREQKKKMKKQKDKKDKQQKDEDPYRYGNTSRFEMADK